MSRAEQIGDFKPSKGLSSRAGNGAIFALLSAWTAFSLFAIVWVLYTSLKTDQELFNRPWAIGWPPQWANYRTAWTIARMSLYTWNSVVVTVSSVVLITLIASMAAYTLTKIEWRGRRAAFYYFLGGLAVPGSLLLVPLFMMLKDFNIVDLKLFPVGNWWLIHVKDFYLVDSRLGLVLIYTTMALPFTTFILTGFFRTLPTALAESAAVDGASEYAVFWRIYFPLSAPGLITTAIFNFLGVWNEYQFALVFISNPKIRTLPLGLYNLSVATQHSSSFTALFAGLVILIAPSILIFLLLEKRITKGLTVGAIKA